MVLGDAGVSLIPVLGAAPRQHSVLPGIGGAFWGHFLGLGWMLLGLGWIKARGLLQQGWALGCSEQLGGSPGGGSWGCVPCPGIW